MDSETNLVEIRNVHYGVHRTPFGFETYESYGDWYFISEFLALGLTGVQTRESTNEEKIKQMSNIIISEKTVRISEECGFKNDFHLQNMSQENMLRYIRESRGVFISAFPTSDGYGWKMTTKKNGTNLGSSEFSGPNSSGYWDKYEDAIEHAIQTQLSLPLYIGKYNNWQNYAQDAIKKLNKNNETYDLLRNNSPTRTNSANFCNHINQRLFERISLFNI